MTPRGNQSQPRVVDADLLEAEIIIGVLVHSALQLAVDRIAASNSAASVLVAGRLSLSGRFSGFVRLLFLWRSLELWLSGHLQHASSFNPHTNVQHRSAFQRWLLHFRNSAAHSDARYRDRFFLPVVRPQIGSDAPIATAQSLSHSLESSTTLYPTEYISPR